MESPWFTLFYSLHALSYLVPNSLYASSGYGVLKQLFDAFKEPFDAFKESLEAFKELFDAFKEL